MCLWLAVDIFGEGGRVNHNNQTSLFILFSFIIIIISISDENSHDSHEDFARGHRIVDMGAAHYLHKVAADGCTALLDPNRRPKWIVLGGQIVLF